jgi:transposase
VLVVVASTQKNESERWKVEEQRLKRELVAERARVIELEDLVATLREKVATLAKLVFGTSSEKKSSRQKSTTPSSGDDAGSATEEPRRRRGQQPGSPGHGRRDYSGLETVEEIHDVAVEDQLCPHCGAAYVPFGEETSEQVDWQVRIVRIVHRRPTYRRSCRCPVAGVLAAPAPPKAILKGRFTTQFLARLLCEKYVLGRPLERVVTALDADGLEVAKGTLVGALKALSVLLAPLDGAIRARNATAGHLHVDETSWWVFEDLANKTNHRWWLWVFLGPDTTVFHVDPTRSGDALRRHLGIAGEARSLEAGRRLLVSSDFYTVYQSLAQIEGVDPLWCWAHIRRYFIRAADAHKELRGWTKAWLERIGALYVAHRALSGAMVGSAGHDEAVCDFALALDAIDVVRQKEAGDTTLHHAARKVLATLDHEWEGLARHEEFLELPLDNNAAERALRNPVVGRKNYYGSGSRWAAELAAQVWTITATASRADCNPLTYLACYLDACGEAGGRAPSGSALTRFLPSTATKADLAIWSDPLSGLGP